MHSLKSGWIAAALGIYCLWGALLIAQKPGLQEDEALLVTGAVHLRHAGSDPAVPEPHGWISIPLMSVDYVGAVKDYVSLPLVYFFGPRTAFIRLVSLLLGAVGIWGVAKLIAERVGLRAGAAVALILAINPSYLNMVVFDNNAVAAMMAGLGLVCASLATYLRYDDKGRDDKASAFWLGMSVGFAVWARANFVWTLLAGCVAILLVYRRRAFLPLAHWRSVVTGGIVGGAPFLLFQLFSGGATWRIQSALAAGAPLRVLFPYRLFLLAESLLSDGEHRQMWGNVPLPQWQLWFFPVLVGAACAVCLFLRRATNQDSQMAARVAAVTLVLLGVLLFSSRLEVGEHHMIAMLPWAVVVVVVACSLIRERYRWGRLLTVALAGLYCVLAVYWNVASIRGLRSTGGIGDWSDGSVALARHLDEEPPSGELKVLDWGLRRELYVLTDGRQNPRGLFSEASGEYTDKNKSWSQQIQEGGVFLFNGPEHRHFPAITSAFLNALAQFRPITRRYTAFERDGSTYAQVVEIQPNSSRGPLPGEEGLANELSMSSAGVEPQLTGFYQPDERGWRWTKREFSVKVGTADLADHGAWLLMEVFIPDTTLQQRGPVTLSARVGEHTVPPQVYDRPGAQAFKRAVPGDWIMPGGLTINFTLDKTVPAGADTRELGILVKTISVEPK